MKEEEKRKYIVALIQFIGTLVIIFMVQNTVAATLLLLIWWGITFYPFSKQDVVLFLTTSVFFTLVDISVLRQGIFAFSDKDIWEMPYFELFLWGFYFLHASRVLKGEISNRVIPGAVFSALAMLALSLSPSVPVALFIASGILVASLIYFGTKKDIQYTLYLMLMGIIIEVLGTSIGKWSYGIDNYFFWWIITWGISGLVLYRASLPLAQLLVKKFNNK